MQPGTVLKGRLSTYRLDLLPEEVRSGLPLVQRVSEAKWDDFFRVRDYREIEPDMREEVRAVRSQVAQGLSVIRRWQIRGTNGVISSGGRDATSYLWWIERDDETRPVTVHISRSAEASSNEFLPVEVVAAKEFPLVGLARVAR